MMRRFSIRRAAVVILMLAIAFWLGNIGAQYGVAAFHEAELGGEVIGLGDFLTGKLAPGPLGLDLTRVPMVCGAVAAVGILFGAVLRDDRAPVAETSLDKVYGTQEFASVDQRARYAHVSEKVRYRGETAAWPKPEWCETISDDNVIMTENSKVGATNIPIRYLQSAVPNRHVYLMAGSGAGKTWNWLTSNVLQLPGSMVFSDPKGELFRMYARFLEKHGYRVLVLNVRDELHILLSCGYNPLAYCKTKTDIDQIVDIFIRNTTGEHTQGDQQYFVDMERMFYTAVIGLFVFWFKALGNEADCNMPGILNYLELAKNRGADGLLDLDLVFEGTWKDNDFPGFKQFIIDTYGEQALRDPSLPENSILASYRGFRSADLAPETMASAISSCYTRLQRLNNPAMRALMQFDELELGMLGKRRTALFLGIPDTPGPYDFLVSMLLTQIFKVNIDIADASESGHLDLPIWFYLDELANLPKIPNLPDLFATVRSRWINLVAIVQDGQALKNRYGDFAEKIRTNSALFVYLGASRFEDCEQISKEMGYTTKVVKEWSKTTSRSGGSVTENLRAYKVPLMSAEELFNFNEDIDGKPGLAPDMCVTHYRQNPWFLDRKPDPAKHRRYREFMAAGNVGLKEWRSSLKTEAAAPGAEPLTLVLDGGG